MKVELNVVSPSDFSVNKISNIGKRYSWEFVGNFITNNTVKMQLHVLERTFQLTSGVIVNAKSYVMLGLKPWCKKGGKRDRTWKRASGSRVKWAKWKGCGV